MRKFSDDSRLRQEVQEEIQALTECVEFSHERGKTEIDFASGAVESTIRKILRIVDSYHQEYRDEEADNECS